MIVNVYDVTIAVCDSAENLAAVRVAYGEPSHILVPSIAKPGVLQSIKGAYSMVGLVTPQHLLEGPLPTQDSQQLLLFAQDLASHGKKVKITLAASGGIGYYTLQLRAAGLLPDAISFERIAVKGSALLMQEAGLFPTEIDHLVASFQEKKEIELLAATAVPTPQERPSITACITHYNRPQFLRHALDSLLKQTRLPDVIFIADDGSDQREAKSFLAAVETETYAVPVRVLRLKHGFPDAARNAAWREAKTDFVFFMDDDDIAMPEELEYLSQAATTRQSDIVTCSMCYFEDEAQCTNTRQAPRWLPLGCATAIGLYANLFGPQNALFRRSALQKFGGFGEGLGTGHEDWEFYARASLAGARLELLPLPLFWCRRRPGVSWMYKTDKHKDFSRNLQAYLDAAPDGAWDAIRLAFGQFTDREGHVGPMWQKRHERVSFWPKKEKG
jgi:glycosyltransferase involved in cell wall biosynthesis